MNNDSWIDGMNTVITNSAAETRELGMRLAEKLKAGDVILLEGDLGAGKSEFARGSSGLVRFFTIAKIIPAQIKPTNIIIIKSRPVRFTGCLFC